MNFSFDSYTTVTRDSKTNFKSKWEKNKKIPNLFELTFACNATNKDEVGSFWCSSRHSIADVGRIEKIGVVLWGKE